MDDNAILDLYFARSEQAISETDRKYAATATALQTTFSPAPQTPRKASTIPISPPGS